MPIWRGREKVPTVGPSIHVKFKLLDSPGSEYADTAASALGLARIMLRTITTRTNRGVTGLTGNQRDILDYYFVFNGGGQTADFPIIMSTLQMVELGLFGTGLGLKVTNGGSPGYVNSHHASFGTMDKLRSKFGGNKDSWSPGQRIIDNDRLMVNRGSIHVSSSRLDTGPLLSAKTIIHEASHKFASTADFDEKGYTYDSDGTFRAPGLTHAEALNNAESYARFVMMCFQYPD